MAITTHELRLVGNLHIDLSLKGNLVGDSLQKNVSDSLTVTVPIEVPITLKYIESRNDPKSKGEPESSHE